MRNWTKTAGILFMAASAVCSGRWIVAATTDTPTPAAPGAKPAQDDSDPFASSPATQPSSDSAPATQPATKGQSVTASQVNVSDTGTVEIHVNDANLVEVLRMLSLQSQRNIIASKEVHGTVTANLYDVTVKEALDAILHANGYDYREKGNFIYVYTTKELQEIEQASRVKKTEVFRLFYTPAVNAQTLIKPVLSNDAQIALTTPAKAGISSGQNGGTGGDDHAGDDMIVVTDFQENLDRARQIIKEVDARPPQVLVEATILVAQLNEQNQLGVDFTVLGGVNFGQLANINAGSTTGTGTGTTGTGTTGAGSTGSTGSTGTTGTTGSTLIAGAPPSNAVNSALTGSILDNTNGAATFQKGYVAAQFGGSGLNLGIITHDVGIFLQALEGVTDTTVLANPKVLVLNKQQGEVHVGKNLGYKTAVATETLTASNVQFLDTGIRLVFRPYVGDNGYIRMEIHPEDSDGTIDSNGNPQKTTTEITSNIMVRDGRTIVIGGLFQDSTTRARSQVPFLGSLPGVGPLFRSQTDTTVRQEVIILLTPHIIKDYDAYGAASEEEAKDAERMRVGARRGLMPWGRERLAESWYEMAVEEMNKPHPNRQIALWHLNCAINLNPMFTEAMELRVQITGKEVTATDDSAIRSFVRKQVLADRANPTAEEPRPAVVPIDVASNRDNSKPDSAKAETSAVGPTPEATTEPAQATSDVDAPSGPATQPAQPKKDGVQFTYPSTQPAKDDDKATGSDQDPLDSGAATKRSSGDDEVPSKSDDNK